MTPLATAMLCSLFVSFLLTPLVRALSQQIGYLDVPNERSSHRVPTPRSGGFAVLTAIVVGLALGNAYADSSIRFLLFGALSLAILATIDDIRELPRLGRLLAQIVVAFAWLLSTSAYLSRLEALHTWGDLGGFELAASALWIVAVVNAYNFMDGLNGLASGAGVVAGVVFCVMFWTIKDYPAATVAITLAGACAGFIPWNVPSGSIFLGDVGSASLGLFFGALTIRAASEGVPLVASALPLLPFLFDTGVTLVRRAANGEAILSSHRSHLYQRLNQLGWTHTRVSALWSVMMTLSGAVAITYSALGHVARATAVVFLILMHVTLAIWITIRESKARSNMGAGRN